MFIGFMIFLSIWIDNETKQKKIQTVSRHLIWKKIYCHDDQQYHHHHHYYHRHNDDDKSTFDASITSASIQLSSIFLRPFFSVDKWWSFSFHFYEKKRKKKSLNILSGQIANRCCCCPSIFFHDVCVCMSTFNQVCFGVCDVWSLSWLVPVDSRSIFG